MNCFKVQELLYLYAGNDLSQMKMNYVANHLSACKACVLEFDKIRKTMELTVKSIETKQDESVKENIWQQIQNEIPPAPSIQVRAKPAIIIDKIRSFVSNIPNLFRNRPLNIKLGFAASALFIFAAIILIRTQITEREPTMFAEQKPHSSVLEQYPTVEEVNKPGVTVLTMKTENPHIKVVWFFDENLKL